MPFKPNPTTCTYAYSNTSRALTFTTASVPPQFHCFNFAELFGGNATSGFVNQTNPAYSEVGGIHWSIGSADAYDPGAIYFDILYRQPACEHEPGSYASRRLNLYGGVDCTEPDPNDAQRLLDWYGLSCWSGVEGECGSLPYGIASFALLPVPEDEDGTCMTFAQLGAGRGGYHRVKVVASVLVGALVAGSLAL
jgi:hypothetical protein